MSAPIIESSHRSGFRAHNPDVLTCIANLSNDEVFTPPELANQMLDMVEQTWGGQPRWSEPLGGSRYHLP